MLQPSDVVLLPFPFTDLTSSKKRPVLIVSPVNVQGDFVCLQITSKQGYNPVVEILRDIYNPYPSVIVRRHRGVGG